MFSIIHANKPTIHFDISDSCLFRDATSRSFYIQIKHRSALCRHTFQHSDEHKLQTIIIYTKNTDTLHFTSSPLGLKHRSRVFGARNAMHHHHSPSSSFFTSAYLQQKEDKCWVITLYYCHAQNRIIKEHSG